MASKQLTVNSYLTDERRLLVKTGEPDDDGVAQAPLPVGVMKEDRQTYAVGEDASWALALAMLAGPTIAVLLLSWLS